MAKATKQKGDSEDAMIEMGPCSKKVSDLVSAGITNTSQLFAAIDATAAAMLAGEIDARDVNKIHKRLRKALFHSDRPGKPAAKGMSDQQNTTTAQTTTEPNRTPEEQDLLHYLDDCRKREGRAPLTIQEQNLAIEQAKAIGTIPDDE